jgi:hypothetical protein
MAFKIAGYPEPEESKERYHSLAVPKTASSATIPTQLDAPKIAAALIEQFGVTPNPKPGRSFTIHDKLELIGTEEQVMNLAKALQRQRWIGFKRSRGLITIDYSFSSSDGAYILIRKSAEDKSQWTIGIYGSWKISSPDDDPDYRSFW